MKPSRFDSFSDGIFAIILTLLTFELKVPKLVDVSDKGLWEGIILIWPIFLSFMLSFALIFTYWHAHHYISSVYAKSVNRRLTSINALFFFFITLIPFTTSLIGSYPHLRLSIIIYSLNILAIGFSLLWMRHYVLSSGHIEHSYVTKAEKWRGFIRVIVPMLFALAAIFICFYSTWTAFILLTMAIVFNLLSRSSHLVNWVVERSKEEIKL